MADGDVTWKLNGIDLDTALGGFLTDVTVWRPPVTVRRTSIIIPGNHGALSPGLPVFDEPTVTVQVQWDDVESQDDLEEKTNHVTALLTQPTLLLTRVSGDLETSAVVSLSAISNDEFLVGRISRTTAVLAVPGVFFRDTAAVSTDIAFTNDMVNVELPGLSGSTAPIGDAVIRVTGPVTVVNVTDPGTGTGVSWSGSVALGQYLYLSARPISARISSSSTDWLSGGTDVSPAVSFPAAGRLQLWPVVQSATARKVLVNVTGDGRWSQTKIAFRGQGSYL